MVSALLLGLFACTPKAPDTGPGLPPDTDVIPADTDTVSFPEDTSLDSDLNVDPAHTLTMHQWGYWDVSATDAMTGQLRFQEWIDGAAPNNDTADSDAPPDTDLPLACDLTIALNAVPASVAACDGCDAPWEITFTVASGTPGMCHDPELPADQASRLMAWHHSTGEILMNFGNVGLWLPWYKATKTENRIDFDWLATVGVSIPDMNP